MALTQSEKDKLGVLRSSFTNEEWAKLPASDEFARERIAFYSLEAIKRIRGAKEMLDINAANIATAQAKNAAEIAILTAE